MPDRRSVALLIETSNAYGRGLLDGIIAYQREHELWSVYVGEHERGARPPDWMKNWRGDGIIARVETDAIAAVVRRSRLPTVDVSAARRVPNIPWVETNDREIAQLAARHLIDRGFRKLAFCGEPLFNWSRCAKSGSSPFARKKTATAKSLKAARQPRRDFPGPRTTADEGVARETSKAGRRHGLLRLPWTATAGRLPRTRHCCARASCRNRCRQ